MKVKIIGIYKVQNVNVAYIFEFENGQKYTIFADSAVQLFKSANYNLVNFQVCNSGKITAANNIPVKNISDTPSVMKSFDDYLSLTAKFRFV